MRFVPAEYWSLEATMHGRQGDRTPFAASLQSLGGKRIAVGRRAVQRRKKVNPGIKAKGLGHRKALRLLRGIADHIAVTQGAPACSEPQKGHGVIHQHLIGLAHPVPFQHGKLRAMKRPTLTVAPDMSKGKDPPLPRRQQLFHREFGAGVQIHAPPLPVIADGIGAKGMQVGFIAGADDQRTWVYFDEILIREPAAQGVLDAVAGQKGGAAAFVCGGVPPVQGICHAMRL